LKGIDADAPRDRITAVVGPSGAGKSTLVRAINRLIEPTAGEVYLDGEPTSAMNPLELRRRVGMVFQLPALFGATVEEATLYGARRAGRSADAGRLLEMAGLSACFKDKAPQSLSVGEQQRVSIARALALEPEALLMDEPTSALDEAALALGTTSREAVSPILKTALQRAMIPLIDATKTTGIIFLPGAMVGMIIAGADPLEAVRLQIVVLYMLLGSVSIAAILVGLLSYRSFFTPPATSSARRMSRPLPNGCPSYTRRPPPGTRGIRRTPASL
jgi:ABC-type thiamine transport system ATPase subunit